MPSLYVASSLANWERVKRLQMHFRSLGVDITYDWTNFVISDSENRQELAKAAQRELDGAIAADHLLVVMPGGRGTHCELGAMIARCLPLALWGGNELPITILADTDNVSHPTSFHHLPGIKRFTTEQEALAHVAQSLLGKSSDVPPGV